MPSKELAFATSVQWWEHIFSSNFHFGNIGVYVHSTLLEVSGK